MNSRYSGTRKTSVGSGLVAFQWGSKYVQLAINPQQYEYSSPQRTSTFKTQSNVVVENFGQDLRTITFSGNTGAKEQGSGTSRMNGEQRFQALKDIIVGYQQASDNGSVPTDELIFYNNMDINQPSYTVNIAPQGFQYSRDSDNPLLYNYAVSLLVIKPASIPQSKVNDRQGTSGGNETSQAEQEAQNSGKKAGTIVGGKK